MKTKWKWLNMLCAVILVFALYSVQASATIYTVNFFDPDPGYATPASDKGMIPAVSYEDNRALNGWFSSVDEEIIGYEAEFTAPAGISDYGTVTYDTGYVVYTPSAEVAGQTVDFTVYAKGSVTEKSAGVDYTVHVGQQPLEASSNTDLASVSYQVDGGAATAVDGFSPDVTDYEVVLPVGTMTGLPITLTAQAEDANATVDVQANITTNWEMLAQTAYVTVTAEDGVSQKTYAFKFYIQPEDQEPYICLENDLNVLREDGDTIVVDGQSELGLLAILGGGNLEATSAYIDYTSNTGGSLTGVGAVEGAYPVSALCRAILPASGDSVDMTVSLYNVPSADQGSAQPYKTITVHVVRCDHEWSDEWSSDADSHWHECVNENCPETDNSRKDG